MSPRRRLQITVSPDMMVALELLSERSGLPVATQALAVLRAGLDRTINSAEGQQRARARRAFATRDQWLNDTVDERRAELALAADKQRIDDDETRAPQATPPPSLRGAN